MQQGKQDGGQSAVAEPKIVNIAAYKFVALSELRERRVAWMRQCRRLKLKGTILLSTEGVNMFLAGDREAMDRFLESVRSEPPLADLEVKESFSERQPFNRMLVKIKKEIIAFGVDQIDPRQRTSPRVSARQLREWLNAGEDVRLLDVRNSYEWKLGTFEGAERLELDDFRHFPAAVESLKEQWRDKKIVTFCTGGIRCEKAAPYLEAAGFHSVFQLDGGILKYFEECGGQHYQGDCFVFDKRVALRPDLSPSGAALCFACQSVLSPAQCQDPRYVEGISCPHCYEPPQQHWDDLVTSRNQALRASVNPLPGSVPSENCRPLRVPGRCDHWTVIDFLESIKTHLDRVQWHKLCATGAVRYQGQPVSADSVVRSGQCLTHVIAEEVEPPVAADIRIFHEDEALVVVSKPAPLPCHPCGRFHRNTLSQILAGIYQPLQLKLAHRLDANTTGVVVLSKSRKFASRLQPQFERGEVVKTYFVRVQGLPTWKALDCDAAISSEPSGHGARVVDPDGLPAKTSFRLLGTFTDGTSLIEAVPHTGRTNQIRIHLWQLGFPVVGDRLYLPHGELGRQATLDPSDEPMCLHAYRIEFRHPLTDQRVQFTVDAPSWCEPGRR